MTPAARARAAHFRARLRSGRVALVLLALLVALAHLWADLPLATHEVYVAQTAREMIAGGPDRREECQSRGWLGTPPDTEWVRPTFNGEPRLNKPPLMYWAVILCAKTDALVYALDWPRVTPRIARFPSALASVLMAVATYVLGRAAFGRSVALAGAMMAVGTVGWFSYANNARPEMLYAATSTAMLACFAQAWRSSALGATTPAHAAWGWPLAGWACAGLALLAKGPQIPALLLAGLVVFAVVEWRSGSSGALRRLGRSLRPLAGVPVMLLVAAPWAVAVLLQQPQADEAWARDLFAGRDLDEGKGLFNFLSPFYLYAVPGLILPWAVLLPFGLASPWQRPRDGDAAVRFDLPRGRLLFWPLLVTIIVMGLSNHRRDYYMLALMPLMTLLTARGVLDAVRPHCKFGQSPRYLFTAAAVVATVCAALGPLGPNLWGTKRYRDAEFVSAAADALRARGEIGTPIFAVGTDHAKLVDKLGERVHRVPTIEAIPLADQHRGLWLLTTLDVLCALGADYQVNTVASLNAHPGDNRDAFALVRRLFEEPMPAVSPSTPTPRTRLSRNAR